MIGEGKGQYLSQDCATKAPAKDETLHVFEKPRDLGLLIGKGGYHSNVVRKPTMCLTSADFLLAVLDECFITV